MCAAKSDRFQGGVQSIDIMSASAEDNDFGEADRVLNMELLVNQILRHIFNAVFVLLSP